MLHKLFVFSVFVCLTACTAYAQTTAFTYQGKLNTAGNPANANYDMQFRLFDMVGAGQGTQQGSTVTISPVPVSNGIFKVELDFGAMVFASGADRFLEISLRPEGNMGGYTSLAPRQRLTSAPYSIRSREATTADNLSSACVGCVLDTNINSVGGNKVTGTVANATTAVNATNATNATTATTATTAGNVSGIVAIANGGTGSATQNFVDLTTDQTIDGNKTFNGTVTAGAIVGNGSGLTNILSIYTLGGDISDIPPNSGVYYFPSELTATVTVNGSQRITGSGSANLGIATGTAQGILVNFCYQDTTSGTVTQFSPYYMFVSISGRSAISASNSVIPPAGSYRVGICIVNSGSSILNLNNSLHGWVMITNN